LNGSGVSVTKSAGNPIFLVISASALNLAMFLGLSVNTYTLDESDTLVSNKPADFSGINEINILLENVELESYTTDNINKNILATIPIENTYNEKIVYNNDYPIQTNNKNINRLRIKLVDEYNDPVLTRSDYTMNLQFITDDIE
jgi:hypothetical protein